MVLFILNPTDLLKYIQIDFKKMLFLLLKEGLKIMNICMKCAAIKGSCCVKRDILITLGDIERILKAVKSDNYFEYRFPADPKYLNQDDDPNWNHYTLHDNYTRRVLKQQENGHCIFLGKQGCILSMDTRPLVCRLHPFDYNETQLLSLTDECPVELLDKDCDLITALGMNRVTAEKWRKMLYDELVSEFILVKAGYSQSFEKKKNAISV